MKDFFTEGYEPPCRSNNYQSNRPSAFEIDLYHTTEQSLQSWFITTSRDLKKPQTKFEQRRLESQMNSILEIMQKRNIKP